jgi:hypothetical protein
MDLQMYLVLIVVLSGSNVSIPESMLMRRHNASNYHLVQEAIAVKIIWVGKEDGGTNSADLFTKSLTEQKGDGTYAGIL